MTKLRLYVLVLLFLAACSQPAKLGSDAPANAVPDLVGDYGLNGISPNGIEYAGTVTVQPGDGAGQYKIQWLITGGIQEGTGILDGNVLKLQWKSLDSVAGQTSGTGSYTVTVNGELYGKRTTDGVDGSSTETCYPNKKH